MDRTNDVRRALESGDPVVGAGASTFAPEMVETYGAIGLDFVWLDFEHDGPSPYDTRLLNGLTRAAEVAGTELLTRLPSEDPHLVRRVLDAGVRNILIPRITSAKQVREAAEAARFRYDGDPGERGASQSRVTRWGTDTDGYIDEEDAAVALGVMVEDRAAVEAIDAILDVPALSFVFVGPADLSTSLGHPGEKSHPEVREAVSRVETAVADSEVALAGIANDAETAAAKRGRGYGLLRVGADIEVVHDALGDRVGSIRDRL
jgi:2-dehydro-3-deoxyglucarate aldolase